MKVKWSDTSQSNDLCICADKGLGFGWTFLSQIKGWDLVGHFCPSEVELLGCSAQSLYVGLVQYTYVQAK